MLTEEAHHMFVGESGMARILERTCQLLRESGFSGDVRKAGGIDLPLIQKFVNFWFSQSLDLHGSEVSSNAAAYFSNGLKGRAEEDKWDEHRVIEELYKLETVRDGAVVPTEVPMRNAMNEVLRDWYVGDCQAGVDRWNKILERHGLSDRLRLPDRKFNRGIGQFTGLRFDPNGRMLSDEEWTRRKHEWLPAAADREYLLAIMNAPVYEAGVFANYIAPPTRGIKGRPVNFEYVRTEA
jgi:benzoyl-CoA 2,3-dioxygenase component B